MCPHHSQPATSLIAANNKADALMSPRSIFIDHKPLLKVFSHEYGGPHHSKGCMHTLDKATFHADALPLKSVAWMHTAHTATHTHEHSHIHTKQRPSLILWEQTDWSPPCERHTTNFGVTDWWGLEWAAPSYPKPFIWDPAKLQGKEKCSLCLCLTQAPSPSY